MKITEGTKLGRYEIRSKIGEGGMGEVYRAFDPKIGREVAIKVLPETLTNDRERLARFEQEAQAAGSLNHPNILSVFDIDTHEDAPYLVSELLDGETLREKLDDGDVSQRIAVQYAKHIATGLAAAHEKGIIHRDLKPENIFITNDERVKILDFGLAKLTQVGSNRDVSADAPTRKIKTDPGMVMGTIGYMSPEQVRGVVVDHRSDLFSFGTILYEMLTGKAAFRGETGIETLNAILKEDPPEFAAVSGRSIPPSLESVVRHCLEKRPERRFQSAGDVAFALEALSGSSGSAATIIAPVSSRKFNRERLIWSGVCAVLLLFAAGLAFSYFRSGTPAQPVRLALQPPSTATDPSAITVSPDGSRVVFRAHNSDGRRVLWVRAFNTLEAHPLSGTEGAIAPFWSPDNRHVGYFAAGKLFRIDTEGGRPQVLCDAFEDRGGSWNGDGVILFSGNEGLYRINASGGQPTLATKLEPTEEAHRWPYFLPDDRHFVFLADASRAENHNIRLGSLDSDETKILFPAISRIVYAPPGYLLFVRQSALFAQRFDPSELKMSGDPVVVADQIADIGGNHEFDYSVSDNGILLYQVGSRISQLTWYDRTGKETERFGEPADYTQVAAFSDSHRAVVTIVDPDRRNGDIWLVDFNRGTKSRITFDPHGEFDPHLSPDGNRVVFASTRKEAGWNALFQIQVTGEAEEELFSELTIEAFPTSWSPDGKSILFNYCRNKETCTLRILSVEGERQSRPYLQTAPFHQSDGQISPDGKWVAYVSEESGRPEIYVQSFPEPGQKRQISTAGGNFPLWRRDGREIFYLSIGQKVMAVDVKTTGAFESGIPQALFQADLKPMSGYGYAAAADGQRFLVNTRTSLPGGPSLIVVLNWATDLKQ